MKDFDEYDWEQLGSELDSQGAVVLEGFCSAPECAELRLAQPRSLRTLDAPLARLYSYLVPIVGGWSRLIGQQSPAPSSRQAHVSAVTLREGERVALHSPTDGLADRFPLRGTLLLSRPSAEFSGGEFAIVERRPRMQSRPMVLTMRQGDLAIFATGARPVRGSQGYYRVYAKHGVSQVRAGERTSLELDL